MSIEKRRQYKDYDEYKSHQMAKTSNLKSRKEWQNKFDGKVKKFIARFGHLKNDKIIVEGQKILCLGARMGEEVVAFNSLGLKALGIDLVANPPFVVQGDFNNLEFEPSSFDVVYTNSFDHAWASAQFFDNVYGVLRKDGIFVIDVFPGEGNFARCEVIFVEKEEDIIKELSGSGKFEFIKMENKLVHLQRRHKESQLVFKKI